MISMAAGLFTGKAGATHQSDKGVGVRVGAIGSDPEDFIHTGHVNDLLYRYRMTSDDVVQKALAVLKGEG